MNRDGYLVVNLKDLTDMVVYTYKKGVMEKTGITRNAMQTIKDRTIADDYLIIRIIICGFNRNKRQI